MDTKSEEGEPGDEERDARPLDADEQAHAGEVAGRRGDGAGGGAGRGHDAAPPPPDSGPDPLDPVFREPEPLAGSPESGASISGVTAASVSGTPRSAARLSASASSRRIRPATASLVIGGSASWPSSSSEACLCSSRSRPASARWSGRSSPRISSARCTRAPAATAARADRRRLASSKLASRLAVARTSRRIRRSSQASTLSCAPSLVSSAPIASPSRTTTRSIPRTSRALAWMPIRRAAPTSASAASGPGQVISSDDDRPGSVSEPWARNAPRQAASASQTPPETTCGGSPRTGRPRWSSRPVWRASPSPSLTTRTM